MLPALGLENLADGERIMLGEDFPVEITGAADMCDVVMRSPNDVEAAVMMRLPVPTAELAALSGGGCATWDAKL